MQRSLLFAAVLSALALPAQAASVEAFNNATVQPGGPRSGANGKNFLNIEGFDFGNFASWGVARFDLTAVKAGFDTAFGAGMWVVDSVALQLTQSNASFTNDGAVSVYFSADDSTSIESGVSPLVYGAFATDFADAKLVTSYTFTEVSSGTVDSYSLYQRGGVNSVGGNALAADIAADHTTTLALAEGATSVAATYAGYSNSSYDGPTLVITAAPVPEPETYALLLAGLGLVGLARRARSVRQG